MIVTFCERPERLVRNVEVRRGRSVAAVERDASEDGVARGGRLLVDLLEHEVLVAALLRRDRIPHHALRRLRDRAPGVVGELDARARDDRHLLVAEEHDIARVAQDRRDVGGDEELVRRRGRRRSAARCGRRRSFPGSSTDTSTSANMPRISFSARRTAFSRPSSRISRSTRWATISVSVSVLKSCPCAGAPASARGSSR